VEKQQEWHHCLLLCSQARKYRESACHQIKTTNLRQHHGHQ